MAEQKADPKSGPCTTFRPSHLPAPRDTVQAAQGQGWAGGEDHPPLTNPAALLLPSLTTSSLPSSPQFSSPKSVGTWSPRRRRSSYSGPAKSSSRPVHSKCPSGRLPPSRPGWQALGASGGHTAAWARAAPSSHLERWARGAGLQWPGPQPSRPDICRLLKKGKRYQGAASKENICFKGC